MRIRGRALVSIALSLSLVACGGGGSGGSAPPISGTPTPTPSTSQCSLSAQQDWVLSQMQEWYLFPTLLDTTVNKANYTTLQSYIDALTARARAEGKDRYLTYATSIAE